MEKDLKAVEDAEVRLESRSRERRATLERRDRRRRWIPWLICPLLLPAAGAAALLAIGLEGRPAREAAAIAAACVLVPALLAGWVGRRHGKLDAVLWALVCAAIELALVVGVGFLALDLAP